MGSKKRSAVWLAGLLFLTSCSQDCANTQVVQTPVQERTQRSTNYGKAATLQLEFSSGAVPSALGPTLAQSAVHYVMDSNDPEVLIVLDPLTPSSHIEEADAILSYLSVQAPVYERSGNSCTQVGVSPTIANVEIMDMQGFGGLRANDLQGYNVIWYVSPVGPMISANGSDHLLTLQTLKDAVANGKGVIFSGLDIVQTDAAGAADLRVLTGAQSLDDGVSQCGDPYPIVLNDPVYCVPSFDYPFDIDLLKEDNPSTAPPVEADPICGGNKPRSVLTGVDHSAFVCAGTQCTPGATRCGPTGDVQVCVEDFHCNYFDTQQTCPTGQLCYDGNCGAPPTISEPELPGMDHVSVTSYGLHSYPIDSRVKVIPYDAFMKAINGRHFDTIPQHDKPEDAMRFVDAVDSNLKLVPNQLDDSLDISIKTTAMANDPNIVGLYMDYANPVDSRFEGDIFIVVMDPTWSPSMQFNPYSIQGFTKLESRHHFVAVAHGLSGHAPWIGEAATFIGRESVGLPSSGCCGSLAGAIGGLMCGIAPGGLAPGPSNPECDRAATSEGNYECPGEYIPDLLELGVLTLDAVITPPRMGAAGSQIIPDPLGLTVNAQVRANGLRTTHLYAFDGLDAHVNDNYLVNFDPNLANPGALYNTIPYGLANWPMSMTCDECSKVSCDPETPLLGGSLDNTGIPNECGVVSGYVDPVCAVAQTSMMGSGCGQCNGCGDPSVGAPGTCLFTGNMATGDSNLISMNFGGSFGACRPGPSTPDYCKYAVGTNDACSCDSACQAEEVAFMASLIGCKSANGASGGGAFACCGSGDSCVCTNTGSGTQLCTTCEDGVCANFVKDNIFDSRYFNGASSCRKEKDGENVVLSCNSVDDYNDYFDKHGKQATSGNASTCFTNNGCWIIPKVHRDPLQGTGRPDTTEGRMGPLGNPNPLADVTDTPAPGLKRHKARKVATNTPKDKQAKGGEKATVDTKEEVEQNNKNKKSNGKTNTAGKGKAKGTPADKANTHANTPKLRDHEGPAPETGADPVLLASGAFTLAQTDLSFPGPVRSLDFRRTYESQSLDRTVLGSNWLHNYDVRVQPINVKNAPAWVPPYCKGYAPRVTCALVYNDGGGSTLYILDPASRDMYDDIQIFMPQSGSTSTLYLELGATQWRLRTAEGHVQLFDRFGYLKDDRDRFGNGFTIVQEPMPAFRLYYRYCHDHAMVVDPEDPNGRKRNPFQLQSGFDKRLCIALGYMLGEVPEVHVGLHEGWEATDEDGELKVRFPAEVSSLGVEGLGAQPLQPELRADLVGEDYVLDLMLARQYIRYVLSLGVLPENLTGERRMRPVKVIDDLGNELVFTYHEDPQDWSRFGLLKEVAGPLGNAVKYEYGRPSDYPDRLNEMFLTKVTRDDSITGWTSETHDMVNVAPSRVVEFTYNWSGATSGAGYQHYDTVDLTTGKKWHELMRDKYLDFFGHRTGCSLSNAGGATCSKPAAPSDGFSICLGANSSLLPPEFMGGGSSVVCTGSSTLELPGNPCQLAQERAENYVANVADNIIKVVRNPGPSEIVESESRYIVDPNESRFDRVVAQRYGGMSRSGFEAPYTNLNPNTFSIVYTWETKYHTYYLDYFEAGPVSDTDFTDLTETSPAFFAIAGEILDRYDLEPALPASAPGECWLNPDSANCPEVAGVLDEMLPNACDWGTFELTGYDPESPRICNPNRAYKAQKALPGWKAQVPYQDLPPASGYSAHVRSRVSCEQIAEAVLGNAMHNDLTHRLTLTNGQYQWQRLVGDRENIERNMTRICRWSRVQDRDGIITYRGLNYRGQVLVEAVKDKIGNSYTYQESFYNADGNLIERREPVRGIGDWDGSLGYVTFEYDEIDPVARPELEWLPFWWTRRSNLLKVSEYPSASGNMIFKVQGLNKDNASIGSVAEDGPGVARKFVTMHYEPLFNQLRGVESGYETIVGGLELESSMEFIFDYQEFAPGSPLLAQALQEMSRYGIPAESLSNVESDVFTASGVEDLTTGSLIVDEVPLYGTNLNLDTASGVDIIGFPYQRPANQPDDDHELRVRGAPVLLVRYDPKGENEPLVEIFQYAPHGLPSLVYKPGMQETHFEYYEAGVGQTDVVARFGPRSDPSVVVSSTGNQGLLARMVTYLYDHKSNETPAPNGVVRGQCNSLKGPYQWITDCPDDDLSTAQANLTQLGVPAEVISLLVRNPGVGDESPLDERMVHQITYNEQGHPYMTWQEGRITKTVRDTDGRVVDVYDPSGVRTHLARNVERRVTTRRLFDSGGSVLRDSWFEYDDEGRILARCDDINTQGCSQQFGLFQDIAFNADRDGTTLNQMQSYALTTYRYTPEGLLHKQMGPTGDIVEYKYDSRGRTTRMESVSADGTQSRHTDYTYQVDGPLALIQRGDGTTNFYNESMTYDGFDNMTQRTDARGVNWYYAYDASSRPVAAKRDPVQDPAQAPVQAESPYGDTNTPADWEVLTQYDGFGRSELTNTHRLTTSFTEYSKLGLPHRSGGLGQSDVWTTFDLRGNPVWSVDEAGNQTVHVGESQLKNHTGGPGGLTSFGASISIASSSVKPSVRTSNLTQTSISYSDVAGRVLKSVMYGSHEGAIASLASEVLSYSALGYPMELSNPEGVRTRFTRNAVGWPLAVENARTAGASPVYDVHMYTYNPVGKLLTYVDPMSQQTSTTYSGFGAIYKKMYPLSGADAYDEYAYDSLGRMMTHKLRADNGFGGFTTEELNFVYDANHLDLIRVDMDVSGVATPLLEHTYDDLGRRLTSKHHNLKAAQASLPGTLVETRWSYDVLGRVESEKTLTPTATGDIHEFAVTSNHSLVSSAWRRGVSLGHKPPAGSMANVGTAWNRDYDRMGRLTAVNRVGGLGVDFRWLGAQSLGQENRWTNAPGVDPLIESRTYDPLGRRLSIDYQAVQESSPGVPSNASWGDTYCAGSWDATKCNARLLGYDLRHDIMGRVTSFKKRFGHTVVSPGGGLRDDSAHRVLWRGYGYNARGHLSSEWRAQGVGVDVAGVDALGNHIPQATMAVQIDALGQSSNGTKWLWQRDQAIGSLTSIEQEGNPGNTLWSHPNTRKVGHRLNSVVVDGGTHVIEHDARGRVSKSPTHDFEFNALGQLVLATKSGSTQFEGYLYDAQGRLAKRIDDMTQEQLFVYDGSQMVAAFDGMGQIQWQATWGGALDHLVEWQDYDAGGKRYVPLRDHRNSIVALWDTSVASGSLEGLVDYDGHGRTTLLNDDESIDCLDGDGVEPKVCMPLSGAMPFGFNSAWRSDETGLYWMRNRWYSPKLGEFISPDPLEYIDSANMYAFAAFDPINGWDPLGLSTSDLANTGSGLEYAGGLLAGGAAGGVFGSVVGYSVAIGCGSNPLCLGAAAVLGIGAIGLTLYENGGDYKQGLQDVLNGKGSFFKGFDLGFFVGNLVGAVPGAKLGGKVSRARSGRTGTASETPVEPPPEQPPVEAVEPTVTEWGPHNRSPRREWGDMTREELDYAYENPDLYYGDRDPVLYHRRGGPVDIIAQEGELMGLPREAATNPDRTPFVRAYYGPVPKGMNGIEFTSRIPPGGSRFMAEWSSISGTGSRRPGMSQESTHSLVRRTVPTEARSVRMKINVTKIVRGD